jgi:uncharacterized membrane protein
MDRAISYDPHGGMRMAERLSEILRQEGEPLTPLERRALAAALVRLGEPRSPEERFAAEQMTLGQRAADVVTTSVGSWTFILIQSGILLIWLIVNSLAWLRHWDPYPFILLNLVLSFQAAFTAPIIMMSQNRQAARDRTEAVEDYAVDRQAEEEVEEIQNRLDDLAGRQWDTLVALQREQLDLLHRIDELSRAIHQRTSGAE